MNMKKETEGGDEMDRYTPEWAFEANLDDSKPSWVDKVPHELWELGDVFFPIPRGKKGYNYPHHLEEKRFSPDDEIFNAYMEAGAGYGICCAGDLAVVDIDEKEYADHITDMLPETAWQITGSGEGYHLFYRCPGLVSRIILRIKVPDSHIAAEGYGDPRRSWSRHIGEVKCDPHGYVVGPGSVHPSGNKYGPLVGDGIEEIDRDDLESALSHYVVDDDDSSSLPERHNVDEWDGDIDHEPHSFYGLSADDVLPWLEIGNRIPHPIHGSTTGMNFMKNPDGETFTCWRCQYGRGDGCGLSGPQFLAVKETGMDCDAVRANWHDDPKLHFRSWRAAVRDGHVSYDNPPYRVILGFALYRGLADDPDDLSGEVYWSIRNALLYEQQYLRV